MAELFQRAVMHAGLLALALCVLLWPFARHADRRGGCGLLADALRRLRKLRTSVLTALAGALIAAVAYSGKNTNGVQNLPPSPPQQPVPAQPPSESPSVFDFPRTVTETRAAVGFALVGVGTNETFAFDPPAGATVCDDWRMYGSASRWAHVSPASFVFPFGGTNATTFTFLPGGVAYLAGGADAPRLMPFGAEMGIAPERLWEGLGVTSRLWTATSPSNTFLATWQGALLGRQADNPVDVQLELFPDGGFVFRYGLTRLASDDDLADVRVGAWNAGGGESYAIPSRTVTSARWRPVVSEDATNPDRDGDGVTTVDELFFLGTDPGNPDSDFDGLSDGQELALGLGPLDPYSNGGLYSDGFALKIGGEDPFACPEGSTNTVLEHVFYSGTTNGAFAYPQSSDGMGVLRVSVSGSGAGDLIVGSQVVPLLAPPQMRSGSQTLSAPLLVRIVKGETCRVWRRGGEGLNVVLDSDDFAFGTLPPHGVYGHVNFPNTAATPACIHDFNARRKRVSLPLSRDAEELAATWEGSMDVAVSNIPPRSAAITGYFPARSDRVVTYTLSHPQYLFGRTTYVQPVRFCPCPADPDPDDPDSEEDPPWYSGGEGDDSEDGDTSHEERWCCFWGTCDGSCGCGDEECCGSSAGGSGAAEDFDENCPVHAVPYAACACLHASAYTNAVENVPPLGGVLYIRDPPVYEPIDLVVPEQYRRCCPCPDHSTNYVGVAYKSYRLRLVDASGLPFRSSGESCTVNLAGVYPSSEVGDATLAFVRNGEICQQHDKTVLGVTIKGNAVDLAAYDALNPDFGYPMTVRTNLTYASEPDMKLVTNVRLPGGNVHLELAEATAPFAVWYCDRFTGVFRKLLDSATMPVKDLPMAWWKALMRRASDGSSGEMPVYVTSPTPGTVNLLFRYWNVIGGKFVQDEATQRITSVRPPLLADYNWDFSADAKDALDQGNGRKLYFWVNNDTWTGDDAFAAYDNYNAIVHPGPITLPSNGADMVVNGRNDLVNLCPLTVDLSKFIHAWGTASVRYVFYTGSPGNVRFVPVRTKWNKLDCIVKEEQKTISGEDLHSATLLATSLEDGRESGYVLPPELLSLGASGAGVLAVEFAAEGVHTLRIVVKDNGSGDVLFDSPVSVRALDVHKMYRWLNLDGECGATTDPKYNDRLSVFWPDAEHADANVVFVHGYNMHPSEAWDWSQAMFKRLRWSGMDAGFTAVLWRGNESQLWISHKKCYATRNYHQNVLNAFRTAGAFAAKINTQIPGERKYMIAHSLGNMLVSAARQFHGLQYEKYFMLNAAVPIEAYDAAGSVTEESKYAMTPSVWRPYPDRVRATHWYELFLSSPNDARQGLTWKGLFKDVDNTINFYSSQDEVVANGNGNWKNPLTRKFAWYNQERARGSYLVSFSPQAGWEFSDHYIKADFVGLQNGVEQYNYRGYKPEETFSIADTNLMVRPFFKDFSDGRIYGEGGSAFLQANDTVRWYALSHGIPAESFAAGANPVPKWGASARGNVLLSSAFRDGLIRNVNMARNCVPGSDEDNANEDEKEVPWIHSYFIGNSLFDTTILYEALVEQIGSTKPQKSKEVK